MTTRSKKQETNEVIKAVKDVSRKMDDFTDAVERFQALKDSAEELHNEIKNAETANEATLQRLSAQLQDNKLSKILEVARELKKVVIPVAEYEQLKIEAARESKMSQAETDAVIEKVRNEMNDKALNMLKVQGLENDCAISSLRAQVEVRQSEIESLQSVIANLRLELTSQKELTANIANVNRSNNNSSSSS